MKSKNKKKAKPKKKFVPRKSKKKLKPHYNKDKKKDYKTYEIDKWMEKMEKKFLKIKDITKLKKGDKLKLVCFTRNFEEDLSNAKVRYRHSYRPVVFLRKVQVINYTHGSDLNGTAVWTWGKEVIVKSEPFEFQIKFKKHNWYPLKNGMLPKRFDMPNWKTGNLDETKSKIRSWKKFPTSTLIGFRGPMIEHKYLKDAPDVYWEDSEFGL